MKKFKSIIIFSLLIGMSFAQVPIHASEDDRNSKEESVYQIVDANGMQQEMIVSTHLDNRQKTKVIHDKCDLQTVENIKGKEKYTSSKGVNTWKANGKDIYYQGVSTKKSPVGVNITYYLDEKEISAKELKGKSGYVRIHFEYLNNEKVRIEGKDIAVPFLMVTGIILDNTNFSNVSITNGKVINDGDRNLVIGYGLPRLDESLGMKSNEINLNGFDLKAKVKNFKWMNTLTYASSELLNDLDLSKVNNKDSLFSAISTLGTSADQLVLGSNELALGIKELQDKSKMLSSGVNTLSKGSISLNEGSHQLKVGVNSLNAKYKGLVDGIKVSKDGASTLADGLQKVASGMDQLVSGQAQLQTGIDTAYQGLGTIKTYLNGSIQKDESVYAYLKELYDASSDFGEKEKIKGYMNQLKQSDESSQEIGSIQIQTSVLSQISDSGQHNSQNLADGLYRLKAGITQLGTVLNGDTSNPQQVGLKDAINHLNLGASNLHGGITQVYDGSKQIQNGISSLDENSGILDEGATQLRNGITNFNTQLPVLLRGVDQLEKGSSALNMGMRKFNEEGIQKLVKLFNGDIKSLTNNLKGIIEAGRSYQSFSGLSDGMNGKVKFIIKTASIGE